MTPTPTTPACPNITILKDGFFLWNTRPKMLCECQKAFIWMRRRVTQPLIRIQAVCIWHYGKGLKTKEIKFVTHLLQASRKSPTSCRRETLHTGAGRFFLVASGVAGSACSCHQARWSHTATETDIGWSHTVKETDKGWSHTITETDKGWSHLKFESRIHAVLNIRNS